jgi:hypothetical protein
VIYAGGAMNPLFERGKDEVVIGDDGELLAEREPNNEIASSPLPNEYLDQFAPFDRGLGFQLLSGIGGLLLLTILIASILSVILVWFTDSYYGNRVIPLRITIIPLGIIIAIICYMIARRRPDKQKRKKPL